MVARDRLVSHLQAERAADIAEVARPLWRRCLSGEFAALEVGAALRLTRTGPPSTSWRSPGTSPNGSPGSTVCWWRVGSTCAGPGSGRGHVASRPGHSPGRSPKSKTAPRVDHRAAACPVRRLCPIVDPEDATTRAESRRGPPGRGGTHPGRSATSCCSTFPDRAVAAQERIDAYARALPADGRTIDQRRADAALDLLCGHGQPMGRGMVDLTVDLTTLLGITDTPGDFGGWGPVIADIASHTIEPQATGTGRPPSPTTTATRTPSPYADAPPPPRPAGSGPGTAPACSPDAAPPARHTDTDHTTRHTDGGPTLEHNLAPLCRYHHRAKDQGQWRYRRQTDGTHQWTSPHGHTYTTSGRSP